jgi:hypothetical protein
VEAFEVYFNVTSWHLLEQTKEKHDKPVRTVGVLAGIQTGHLLSTSQRHRYLSQSVLNVLHGVEKRKTPTPAKNKTKSWCP